MKKLLYILFLISGVVLGQNEALFEKANTLYNQEKYQEAISLYDKILKSGEHSVSLYFNKANAHYKRNELAASIYNYEKALQLDPANEDVLNNLSFAANMKIDEIEVIPTTGFSKIFNGLVNSLSFETWAVLAILFMIIAVLAAVKYLMTVVSRSKRMFFAISGIGLLFSLITLLFAFKQETNTMTTTFAIVFAEESRVNSEPKMRSEEAFTLHEGTKVKVLEDFEDWTKIKLTNGSVGWIVSKDIKKL